MLRWWTGLLLLGTVTSWAPAQPRLILPESSSFRPGDVVPGDVTLLDESLKTVRLVDLIDQASEVVVLVIFGGAASAIPEEPFRGPLWCQDSFDDLAVQRALVNAFTDRPVQFIAVAVPPVFATDKYGYPEGVFLKEPGDSPVFWTAVETFIRQTIRYKDSGLLPFDRLYFDPRLSLLSDKASADEERPDWLGRFKWQHDPRRYGAPTIWLMDRSGRILADPYWGNEYGATPPVVNYGFRELEQAVNEALKPKS